MSYPLQRLLLILGLVLIPFYEILLRILPFVACHAPDSRVTKEMLAMVFSLSIGLIAIFEGKIKVRNKYVLIIPVYLLFNLIICPHVDLNINNNEVGDFYFWKPFSEVVCFLLMFAAVSNMKLDKRILNVMVICGSVMAGYVVLQQFGLDQFWIPRTQGQFTSVRAHLLGGNLGQPTIVSSWIIMMIPLAIYLKKWWLSVLMVLACFMTQGAMVIGSIFVIGSIYLFRINKIFILLFSIILFSFIFLFTTNHSFNYKIIDRMDGRYTAWVETLHDIKNGQIDDNHRFPYTGIGFGRFSFIFPDKHKSEFMQAHNDLMEFCYDCGIVGVFLIIASLYVIFRGVNINSNLEFSILLSFIGLFVCSLGSFPFQLGTHQFYAVTLLGFLNKSSIRRG